MTPAVLLGDSIIAVSYQAWFDRANEGAHSPFRVVNNAGVGGNQINQMVARLGTDVTPYAPTYCMVEGGGNDVRNGRSAATIEGDFTTLFTNLRAAGIEPIASTVLPNTTPSAPEQAVYIAVNNWLRSYCLAQGIALCDWSDAMCTDVDGTVLDSALTGDGVHPNNAGLSVMANAVMTTILGLRLHTWA